MNAPANCLVTGGGGFLGAAIVRRLVAGGARVTSFSRRAHPALAALGVRQIQGDLADANDVERAMAGIDCCFHSAAKTGIWGDEREFERTNVDGTRHVVAACLAQGVARLVHTSSPSVCFDGRDHRRAGSDLPIARRFLAAYPRTKAEAERIALAAHGRDGLAVCALRPHLIFGPGDPHLLPRIVSRARAGKLRVVGRGTNEVTLCYVENAAHAHVLAAQALDVAAPCAGRAWFVGQEQPVLLWAWLAALLAELGIVLPRRRVPERLAWTMGAFLERLWRQTGRLGDPPMTRFLAAQLARSHSYDMAPARAAFGYREIVSTAEATAATIAYLRPLAV